MADSLVIADVFELMGGPGGVQSDIPELQNSAGAGAVFQLLNPGGGTSVGGSPWSLGEPQPTIDIVQSLLLDGERPFGSRASNRTITMQVKITAPDQVTLAAARELLMQAIDTQTWTMTYTPASTGLATVFDCFRAQPSVLSYGFLQNQPKPISVLSLTFQALPYGRTDAMNLTQLAFSSPILGGIAAPPAPVTVDNFGTVSGTNWSRSTSQFVVGPGSAHWTPPAQSFPWSTCTYTKSGLSLNITGLTTMSVWFGQSLDTAHWGHHPPSRSNVTMRWKITDNSGHALSFSRQIFRVPYSNVATTPKWTRYSVHIPQNSATFNYTAVTAYTVTISNWAGGGKTSFTRLHAWLDAITANPPTLAAPASQRGVTYNIMGTPGTARTPVSCQFQLPQSGTVSQELAGSGVWWPPVGVTSVQAECIGGGGAGGTRTTSGVGGGGGGAEYAAEPALTVAAGTPVPYSCGTGGQPGAAQQVVTFSQPGTGNWTCPAGVTTVKAECIAGGSQGAAGGGGGGGGEYAAEPALAVTAGKVYPFQVGRGGFNTQFGFGNAGNGGASFFTGDSFTVTAHGGKMPKSGGTVAGAGGTGSGATTHHNGGAGGTSPSYGGGGGGSSGGSGSVGNTGGNGSGSSGGAGAFAVIGGGNGGAGASNPGFPVAGSVPGGGGGGGYGAAGVNAGAAGGGGNIVLTYTVAAGSPVAGGSTTFGSAGTTVTVVTAHGGSSAALNSATGASGGTGSANTTHNNGGAGFTASATGGGGGGSGGSAAAGTTAVSVTGAAAVADGGKGANGAAAASNPGDAASLGGGGGGADTSGTAQAGGNGGAGNIVLTWTPPLAPFSTLIAHRPGAQSPPELNPCVPINNTADSPVGLQYTVPTLTPGTNALFSGTYTVVLVNYNWDNPTAARQVSVTVNQFEYSGGPNYPSSVTRTITPATDIVNGIVIMGELTLPVKLLDPSNTSGYFTVSVTDTDVNDQFLDVLFLDTQGSTVLVNIAPGNSYVNFFIDEPTADRDLGLVLGSDLDRSQAISVMDAAVISGSPFYIVPGDNLFLAYTVTGAPNLGLSYLNRWYLERIS